MGSRVWTLKLSKIVQTLKPQYSTTKLCFPRRPLRRLTSRLLGSQTYPSKVEEEVLKGSSLERLRKHSSMWSVRIGRIAATEHPINLHTDARPSHQIMYRQGTSRREETLKHVWDQLETGVIEPENSSWDS